MIRVVSQNLPQFKQWELSYQTERSYKITVQNVWIQNKAQMDQLEEDWNRLLFLMFDIMFGRHVCKRWNCNFVIQKKFLRFHSKKWSIEVVINKSNGQPWQNPFKGDFTCFTWDDLQWWFLVQHSVAMLEQCCSYSNKINVTTVLQCFLKLKTVIANHLVQHQLEWLS